MGKPISILDKGIKTDETFTLTSLNPDIIEVNEDCIIGRGIGEGFVRCTLDKNSTVFKDIKVLVEEQHEDDVEEIYIVGNDFIAWNTSETYTLSNGKAATFSVEWRSKIKHSTPIWGDNDITISIKDKYSGTIIITAEFEGKTIEKEIYIKTV